MDYSTPLKHHYKAKNGWMNDPNGLVYFKGYYHAFYQHAPNHCIPWQEPMHWGHARTKDFLHWEELPIALTPETPYDRSGCWSGTAIVKDDKLYLFYTGITAVSVICAAVSEDGISFKKLESNPVIATFPPEGSDDFRDPAVCRIDGVYYCVIASGHPETKTARLLLYRSNDLIVWDFQSVLCEWDNAKYAECPSLVSLGGTECLLATSVCKLDETHFFQIMKGRLENGRFICELSDRFDKGPDQYAGQMFADKNGAPRLITWIPGWKYSGYAEKDIGCMSIPRELKLLDGKITAYPVEELQFLLKDEDECVKRTEGGFVIERNGREAVVYNGTISDLKILRDGPIVEVFVNKGEEVYTALL